MREGRDLGLTREGVEDVSEGTKDVANLFRRAFEKKRSSDVPGRGWTAGRNSPGTRAINALFPMEIEECADQGKKRGAGELRELLPIKGKNYWSDCLQCWSIRQQKPLQDQRLAGSIAPGW